MTEETSSKCACVFCRANGLKQEKKVKVMEEKKKAVVCSNCLHETHRRARAEEALAKAEEIKSENIQERIRLQDHIEALALAIDTPISALTASELSKQLSSVKEAFDALTVDVPTLRERIKELELDRELLYERKEEYKALSNKLKKDLKAESEYALTLAKANFTMNSESSKLRRSESRLRAEKKELVLSKEPYQKALNTIAKAIDYELKSYLPNALEDLTENVLGSLRRVESLKTRVSVTERARDRVRIEGDRMNEALKVVIEALEIPMEKWTPEEVTEKLPEAISKLKVSKETPIEEIQRRLHKWAIVDKHGGEYSIGDAILMLCGETGELAQSYRKSHETGTRPEHDNETPCSSFYDAVGDVLLALVRVCIETGIPLAVCALETLEKVEKRHYEPRLPIEDGLRRVLKCRDCGLLVEEDYEREDHPRNVKGEACCTNCWETRSELVPMKLEVYSVASQSLQSKEQKGDSVWFYRCISCGLDIDTDKIAVDNPRNHSEEPFCPRCLRAKTPLNSVLQLFNKRDFPHLS